MKYAALLFIACLAFSLPATAQIKDSYYYMRDDGVQSPEEMQEEAMTVFRACDSNIYQRQYFDCSCLAGAFLQRREKLGGIAPQEEIVNSLTIGKDIQCANTVEIAGNAYESCMNYSRTFREYEVDNDEYCSCVGNTVAKRFTREPFLDTDYITDLHADAMIECKMRDERNNPMPGQGG